MMILRLELGVEPGTPDGKRRACLLLLLLCRTLPVTELKREERPGGVKQSFLLRLHALCGPVCFAASLQLRL